MSHPLSAYPSYSSRFQQRSRLTRAGRLAVLEERTRLINRIQLLEQQKNPYKSAKVLKSLRDQLDYNTKVRSHDAVA